MSAISTPTQRVVWTACPNGLAANGRLRVSVAIGPQLSSVAGVLSEFPDWLAWPATEISWLVNFGTTAVDATVVSAAPSLPLYQKLFHPTLPVDTYTYQSPSSSRLYSNPAGPLQQGVFTSLYRGLAATVPADGGWHGYTALTSPTDGFGMFPSDDRLLTALMQELLKYFPPNGGPLLRKARQLPSVAIPLAYKFLQPRVTALSTPRPPKPSFDFHQGYALLQRHPALLRLFGFVVDLEVRPPTGLPATVGLSVTARWDPKLGLAPTTDAPTVTMTDTATWLAAPRQGTASIPTAITGGLLPLDESADYSVVTMDTDGALLKSVNFVQAITNARNVNPSADTPDTYGAPSLRSAGLSLTMLGNPELLHGNWLSSDSVNSQLGAPGATLYAEDLAQGYRIDVLDYHRKRWFPLCARTGSPLSGHGYGIGQPSTIVPVPAGDEGWVEPVTTQAPPGNGAAGSPDLFTTETLARWSGWSLVASRPGMHLSEGAADTLASDDGNAPPPGADFPIQIDYAATPGTLPALRFGRTYRFRARVVDLAGNSLPFDSLAPVTHATPPVAYRRLEPVASPVIVPCAPRTPGESLQTLVIRSNYDIADSAVAPCQRHLAPPASSIEMAEAHGVLDDAAGAPSASFYDLLHDRDGLTYKDPTILTKYHGTTEVTGANEWISYPPSASFAVPYLPDVLGCGAALYGLPGAAAGERVIVPFGTGWPDRRAIRLVVRAGSGAPVVPPAGEANGPVTIHAPKASLTTVRLSSWFPANQLSLLLLWEWMQSAGTVDPALKNLILAGGHYMFTPYVELIIVHAVRQPLAPPLVQSLGSLRGAGTSYCQLFGSVRAHPDSTQRVDVLSAYTDPYDDGVSDAGAIQQLHTSRVAELPLERGDNPVISFKTMRHDFGDTKHHEVYYSLESTTRFLEYFTATARIALHGTAAVTVSGAGFARGTVVVTGTGTEASKTYALDSDYAEDDAAGTIARAATSTIPDGATVQVTYVAPPVTRSSLEAAAHPPTAQGYLVNIPSSLRPPAPDVESVLPLFGWAQSSSTTRLTSTRSGNMLRVYLGRPWFQSGVGELLGVIVANAAPADTTFPADLAPLMSGYGDDPIVSTGTDAPSQFKLTDFPLATFIGDSVHLVEQADDSPWAGVAGHEVAWDPTRKLWYADIAMNLAPSYFPFVKLALVRYQPDSVTGVKVSSIVLADLIQVAPDRTMTLTFPNPERVRVTVSGPGYIATADAPTPSVMLAYVQGPRTQITDPDLTWATYPAYANGVALPVTSQTDTATTWAATVKLPFARGFKRLRILVAESEQHSIVQPGNLGSRITYLDAVEI